MVIPSPITVEATLQPDGMTLHLAHKLTLPAGPVTVTVQQTAASPAALTDDLTIPEAIKRIAQARTQRGCPQLSEAEMSRHIAELRGEMDDYDQRWQEIWAQTRTPPDREDSH